MAKSYFEQLHDAINNRDWSKVEKVYEGITGQKITPKEDEYEREDPDDGVTTTNATFGGRKNASGDSKKAPIKVSKVNLFKDDGALASDKRLKPEEKKAFKRPKSNREAAKTVTVKCSKCQAKAFILESLLKTSVNEDGKNLKKMDSYICGDCLAKKGR